MDNPKPDRPDDGKGKKVRVDLRRNRQKPGRIKNWTEKALEAEDFEVETPNTESVVPKGDLSRKRTVIVDKTGGKQLDQAGLIAGVVLAVRGQIIEVDDGTRVWNCVMRRMQRTRLIKGRNAITTGDRVLIRLEPGSGAVDHDGVIERVEERHGVLSRIVRKRVHDIVANVDNALIVSSAGEPAPKPHLIDRYIVAALDGGITPIVCMNKIDLDEAGYAASLLERYAALGYRTLCTSAATGQGVDELRDLFRGKSTVIAGQSGVGKSSLLNAVQPGLALRVGTIVEHTQKGRHTTTTALLIRLECGGYVADTPGVKSLDIASVPLNRIEMHFLEFAPHIPRCKFSDCTHRHEGGCAVIAAVESGEIHPERYESYVRIFEELAAQVGWSV